ncbi:response regulator transcription factor [Burkholderia sp. BCC1977]|uniref:response regulator transcription factor n=1 Tax=Burkholderia sp. BCC1977 TaxID=2817440 RepID=UPI002ABE9139|nr:response regulator transcription factor [Burkholderia sp. BCC1977]
MIVYLIENDETQARSYRDLMERADWRVSVMSSGERALREIQRAAPDVVVLDRHLPDIDGLEVVAWIRKRYPVMPILVLTIALTETAIVEVLEAGADDYIPKPPRERELIARIRAKFRRRHDGELRESAINIGRYHIDIVARTVYLDNERIVLSPKEYDIVELLARNVGQLVSRHTVIGRVWGQVPEPSSFRSLDTHIYRIRQKLNLSRANGMMLRVIYTHGYRLDDLGRNY